MRGQFYNLSEYFIRLALEKRWITHTFAPFEQVSFQTYFKILYIMVVLIYQIIITD